MTFASTIASLILSVVPSAVVIGPNSVAPGPLVLYDSRTSTGDAPVEWFVITSNSPYQFVPQPNGTALFSSQVAGVYNIVVIARGQKDATSPVVSSVAFVQVTVGTPAPPPTPVPTDPLAAAAVKFHEDLDAAYAASYGAAAASAGAAVKPTFASIMTALQTQTSAGVNTAFATRFAPWKSQLPPSGTEPTTPAQWALIAQLFGGISSAFGGK